MSSPEAAGHDDPEDSMSPVSPVRIVDELPSRFEGWASKSAHWPFSVKNLKIIKLKGPSEIARYQYGDIVDLRVERPHEFVSAAPSTSEERTTNLRTGGFLVKPLIEVFSACLDGVNEDCMVSGDLIIYNHGKEKFMYRQVDGEHVPSHGPISLERKHWIDADTDFFLKMSLEDYYNVGEGYIELSKSEIETYWNKRLCSVVKGDFGFVAVHYTPFKAALVAQLEITFGCSASIDDNKIYGSVIAFYGDCDYSTFNDSEYFRSRLFDRVPRNDEKDLKVLEDGPSRFSVVKSFVAVPEGSSLIIQGNLRASEKMNVYLNVETWPDLRKSTRRIDGENCYVEVSVMWQSHDPESVEAGLASEAEFVEEATHPNIYRIYDPYGSYRDITGRTHVFGAAMVEVFSVCIRSCTEHTKELFQIHGEIQLTIGRHQVFCIYDRKREHAQTIIQDGLLWLRGPHLDGVPSGIMATGPLTISMKLGDDTCDGVCDSSFEYSLQSDSYFDKGQSATCGFATLYWAPIRVAVLASVEVSVIKWGDIDSGDVEVYGSLVARYGRNYHYQLSCASGEEENFKIVLFDAPQRNPISLAVGSPVRLLRHVVAVPSSSSLVIEADLWDDRSGSAAIQEKIADFAACHEGTCTQSYRGIQVKVTWDHRPSDIRPFRNSSDHATSFPDKEGSNTMDELSAPRVSDPNVLEEDEVEVRNLIIERGPCRRVSNMKIRKLRSPPFDVSPVSCGCRCPLPEVGGSPYVEVFSIYVAGMESNNFKVYGTINLPFLSDKPLYERTRDNAEAVAPYEPISIVSGHAISGHATFYLAVALKDGAGDADVSRGVVCLDPSEIERKFDRRLSSVVRGPQGYAAVHYSPFSRALCARIRVRFAPRTGERVVGVSGHLTAHYGLYYYGTDYAKAYYTIGLFDRTEEEMARADIDSDGDWSVVPLLKSVVVVPVDTSLVVWGSLSCDAATDGERAIRGVVPVHVEMWPQRSGVTKRVLLRGRNCGLEVGVEWTG